MLTEAILSDALAQALGNVVAEKQKEFDRIIALREAELKLFEMRLEAAVEKAVGLIAAKLLEVRDGKDGEPGPQGIPGLVGPSGEPGPQGLKGDIGDKGDSGDQGQEGKKGDRGESGEIGPRGERGEKGEAGEKGDKGEQGLEGKPGRDGRDGLPGVPGTQGEKGMDGKNGTDGKDGKNGAGFESWNATYDDDRTIIFSCGSGEETKEFTFHLPIPIYRGRWAQAEYKRADEVTYGGNVYRALKDTDAKPGMSDDWCIATNRGRDGRDGKDGAPGLNGPEGRPGRDLTQLGPDGKKW